MKVTYSNKNSRIHSTVSTIWVNTMQIFFILMAFIWLLAVIKVFLLEGNHRINYDTSLPLHSIDISNPEPFLNPDIQITKSFRSQTDHKETTLTALGAKIVVPTFSEWAFIRASPDYKIAGNREHLDTKDALGMNIKVPIIENVQLKKASDLSWPPVLADGSISVTDGVEVMPIVGDSIHL
jgi:hypothetical protein